MNKDIVKQLKSNQVPFYFMDGVDQLAIQSMWEGDVGCIEHLNKDGWIVLGSVEPKKNAHYTYRPRLDYAAEPETVEYRNIGSSYLYMHENGHTENKPTIQAPGNIHFIGFRSDGWLFGRLYKHKVMDHHATLIKADELAEYEVLPIDAVLFSNAD